MQRALSLPAPRRALILGLMIAPAQILETTRLLETSAGALVAGVGIPAAVSFAVLGLNRGPDCWREGQHVRGAAYGALGGLGLALALAIVAIGLAIVVDGPT